MEELWDFIEDCPAYLISNLGRVKNYDKGTVLSAGRNNYGDVRVQLRNFEGRRIQKTVRVLVANAFVAGRTEIFDTVIQLDGNKENCRADNLAWRPEWFAWKFVTQFKSHHPLNYRTVPIRNIVTGAVYSNTIECVQTEGVLCVDVWFSIFNGNKVFPDGGIYESL